MVGSNSRTRPCRDAEAGGQLPVLALDVVNDGRTRPGQQRWNDEADTFAGPGGRETQHVLRSVMTKVVAVELAQHHAIRTEKSGRSHLPRFGPARRAIGLDILGLARPPDRHADRHRNRNEGPRRRDEGPSTKT